MYSKYPAFLSVTVGSYETELTQSITLTRPMSVMEEEKTGDIYAYGSSDDCPNTNEHQLYNTELTEQQKQQHSETNALNLLPRLPGEVKASILNIFYS